MHSCADPSGSDATQPMLPVVALWRARLRLTVTAWLVVALAAVMLASLLVTLLRRWP